MQFKSDLISFINERLPEIHTKIKSSPRVDGTTLLFEMGLIDSLAILHLIAYVECVTGNAIPPRKVVMKYFRTVDAICAAFGPANAGG